MKKVPKPKWLVVCPFGYYISNTDTDAATRASSGCRIFKVGEEYDIKLFADVIRKDDICEQ